MGILGIVLGLAILMFLSFRGWSILLLAPTAALIAALFAGEHLLAHWTQTFMGATAQFLAQFFPLFLLGALFGKLMDDSGSVSAIADFMTRRLGKQYAILAVVLAGALITYGGVSLFVAFFVLAPMAQALFRAAAIPRRLMPATIVLGTSTFTMSALPGTPSIQNAIPMPFFNTTPFAAPGLGIIASIIMLGFGLWWLGRAEAAAKRTGEQFGAGDSVPSDSIATDQLLRERATNAREFDLAELNHGCHGSTMPSIGLAVLPILVVIVVNFLMSFVLLPHFDVSFLSKEKWGPTSLAEVGGVWAVVTALATAILIVIITNRKRLPNLRETMDAGANASVLPALSVASLVGFGAVIAAMPVFAIIREGVLNIGGGLLISLSAATNVLAALTGSATGGLTIALDSLGETFLTLANAQGISPSLLHRVAVIGSGTLDSLPHNGAIITLLAVCQSSHRESYFDIVVLGIIGPIIALITVIGLGSAFGSF
ncbi:MAG: GntP family permease [Legionella sp.]|uniref:GntP family permease n=1 Tax=Legionella sp. TaxID=459 RepID=UPI00284FD0D6|nr:GntP family permease [Legionella sp.]